LIAIVPAPEFLDSGEELIRSWQIGIPEPPIQGRSGPPHT
jgi:hypothetical protein